MNKVGLNQLRKLFLSYFEGKGHLILPSSSLVPKSDKSLLLINSGMAPLKPYFTGQETPPNRRVATCQKCIRTSDIELVGHTARHGTFFEMLGNFSFGDYFKKDAIQWAWEFVTEVLGLPSERIWITIYLDDDEAFSLWTEKIGVEPEKIVRMGKEHNFWEIGVGPCGPCSELYFDRGVEHGCGSSDCTVGCECDRFVEFWNLVFTQYNKDDKGNYHPLEHPSIDTGMGLERIAAIVQDVDSLFDVDTIKRIMEYVSHISGVDFGNNKETDISLRIVTDHIRSTVFMIADGILPSNEGRGYVLRRILRRASRHGKLLGIQDMFLSNLAQIVIRESGEAYPETKEKRETILKIIQTEEERFNETIDQGLSKLREYINDLKQRNKKVMGGEESFRLYDTYGFPLDLTKEILEEEGLRVDEESFNLLMKDQRERARAARHESDYMGAENAISSLLGEEDVTQFKGYETLQTKSRIDGIIKDETRVQSAHAGDDILIILDRSPFYAESGGQVGDKGFLTGNNLKIQVEDVSKIHDSHFLHKGKILEGKINIGDEVEAKVDSTLRKSTARNHSATHILHKALREVLGPHVSQAGSLVTPTRLRFDFSHFAPLANEEIDKVERIVNEKIMDSMPIKVTETSFEAAKELGALALFDDQYGDMVRVVMMGDYSTELCGGTHMTNTGQIGLFKIVSETGVAAGIRRIEALTGEAALNWLKDLNSLVSGVSAVLKTDPIGLVNRAEGLIIQLKEYEKEIHSFKRQLSQGIIDKILSKKENLDGVSLVAAALKDQDMDGLREIADTVRDKLGSVVVVLASEKDGKVNLVAAATKDVVSRGVHAGNLIKEIAKITGGGGGGRPDMAQAGGKDPSKIKEALAKIKVLLDQQTGK